MYVETRIFQSLERVFDMQYLFFCLNLTRLKVTLDRKSFYYQGLDLQLVWFKGTKGLLQNQGLHFEPKFSVLTPSLHPTQNQIKVI